MAHKFKTVDVFTPAKPARVTFVHRDAPNKALERALKTPGKQIVLYGHSGSGKTTLLINTLAKFNLPKIVSRCTQSLTFNQLVLNAFDQLDQYYTDKVDSKISSKVSSELAAEYLLIKGKIASESNHEKSTSSQRVLPPQLTPQSLARFLGEVGHCWVLEDFHKIVPEEKLLLAQCMKLFVDMAESFPNLRIIALGAVDTARDVVDSDPEMRTRISEIPVPLMTPDELRQIIDQGEKALNMISADHIKNEVVRFSSGLGSVCHQLYLNLCFEADIHETSNVRRHLTTEMLKSAIRMYYEEASDTLKSAFDKAIRRQREVKYDNGRLILRAMAECDGEGSTFAEIHARIKKWEPRYPSGNLKNYLTQLCKLEHGGVLRYFSSSGRYSFSEPIYKAFALALFELDRKSTHKPTVIELFEELQRLITENLTGPGKSNFLTVGDSPGTYKLRTAPPE